MCMYCRPDPKGYLPIQRAAMDGQTSALRELLSNSSNSSNSSSGGGDGGDGGTTTMPRVNLDAPVRKSGKTVSYMQ